MASYDFSLMQRLAAEGRGEYHETPNHVVVHIPGQERLLVGFDNMAWNREEGDRKPWAFDMAHKRGWGMVGVMCKRSDWFRDPALFAILEGMRDCGVFASYPQVSMYGTSMGGYGACAFASLAPGCTVVAFSPQSTLSKELAPFENRYDRAMRHADWTTGPYLDAAHGLAAAGKAYLVYDPLVPEDKAHIDRLTQPNCQTLGFHYLTHKVPPTLKRMEILKPVATEMVEGTMTPKRFYELLRHRRNAIPYTIRLIEHAVERGHMKLALSGVAHARSVKDNWKLRRLHKTLREQAAEQGL